MPADLSGFGAQIATLFLALATAVAPAPDQAIYEWSEGRIVIPAEAQTARPGPLSWEEFEYCLEPLERLSFLDSASRVTIMAAAQTGKSNIGIVWTAHIICVAPRPLGIGVPSRPKGFLFNSKKLQPVFDKTPELKERVAAENGKAKRGSTTFTKFFPGGTATIFSAGSINDLQMDSYGALWLTETPNFKAELGSRGSPVSQARARMDGWEKVGTKELHESTPGEEGACPVSADFEAGDRGEIYLPCPHCEHSFRIDWEDFVGWENAAEQPYVVPPCCGPTTGAIITEDDMPALKAVIRHRLVAERTFTAETFDLIEDELAAGYLRTYPSKDQANPPPGRFVRKADFNAWRRRPTEGREPSYHFWQILSPLKTWAGLGKDWRDAKGKPAEEASFRQQKLGLPSESSAKAPDTQAIAEAIAKLGVRPKEVPPGTCWLSGTADIQGDRIEWAIYAHGPAFMCRIDRGVIDKDPLNVEAWVELGKVTQRRYAGPQVRPLGIDAFGVDSGGVDGATPRVYEFTRGRANVYAIKGASRALESKLPTELKKIKGKDTKERTIVVDLLRIDGYVVKKYVAYGLQGLVASAEHGSIEPGSILFEDDTSEEDIKQLTGEVFKRAVDAKPGERGEWVQVHANEQLDLAVYAWALAYQKRVHTWDQKRWDQEFTRRARLPDEPAETPMEALWSTPAAAPPMPKAELADNPGGGRRSMFSARKNL
jgi:phage terminase large subunit GpA-like protein